MEVKSDAGSSQFPSVLAVDANKRGNAVDLISSRPLSALAVGHSPCSPAAQCRNSETTAAPARAKVVSQIKYKAHGMGTKHGSLQ